MYSIAMVNVAVGGTDDSSDSESETSSSTESSLRERLRNVVEEDQQRGGGTSTTQSTTTSTTGSQTDSQQSREQDRSAVEQLKQLKQEQRQQQQQRQQDQAVSGDTTTGESRTQSVDQRQRTTRRDRRIRRGLRRAVEATPEGRKGIAAVSPRGGRRRIQRQAIEERLERGNPELAASSRVGLGTRVQNGRIRGTAQLSPVGALTPSQQQERIERILSESNVKTQRTTARDADFSRATDAETLTSEESPGAQFFGTGARERAIEQEAREGSVFAKTFVGGEAIEQAGLEASRAVDKIVPDAPGSTELTFRVRGQGRVNTGIELNPRVGVGTEGERVATQVRNIAVEAPAGAGVIGGLGPKAVGDIGVRAEEALGRDVGVDATITAGQTRGALEQAGVKTLEGIKEEPVGAALEAAAPLAVSKVSPVGLSKLEVPTGETRFVTKTPTARRVGSAVEVARSVRSGDIDVRSGVSKVRSADIGDEVATGPTTTVRGVRVKTPDVVRRFTDRNVRGRTVAGLSGRRPTRGAPDVDLNRVALERFGGDKANQGQVFEPQTQFETEVIGASANRLGGQPAARVQATRRLTERAETRLGAARRGSVGDVQETVASVEGVPESLAGDVVDVLAEQDATIFGSGAVRAQASGFRTPGDIDIVVPDKKAAKTALADAFDDTELDVSRTFDIKEASDFAGLEEGQVFGFGSRSQAPIETESGVRINPIGEELQRKAGASAFVRGAGELTEDIDVGPRANPGGAPRTKDIEDAIAIGEELLDPEDQALREFRAAFDRGPPVATRGGVEIDTGGVVRGARLEAQRFLADETAEARLTGRRSAVDDVVTEDTRRLLDGESPSPARSVDSPSTSPVQRPRSSPSIASASVSAATSAGVGSPASSPSVATSGSVSPASPSVTTSPIQSPLVSQSPTVSGSPSQGVSPAASDSPGVSLTPSVSVTPSIGSSTGITTTTTTIQTPVPPPGTTTTTTIEDVDETSDEPSEFRLRAASDFEKTFEAEVATAETIAFGNADSLSDPDAFTEPGGRFTDTDTTPQIVSVEGDVPVDDVDDLLDAGGDLV